MNNVSLVGRLTKAVELRYSPNGVPVAAFTLAVNRAFTNQQGEREADFISCICFKKTAENLAQYTDKGSQIAVSGSIQTRNYENNEGRRVYITEVIANQVTFLDSKKSSSQSSNNNSQRYTHDPADPFANDGQIDISDDDLPF